MNSQRTLNFFVGVRIVFRNMNQGRTFPRDARTVRQNGTRPPRGDTTTGCRINIFGLRPRCESVIGDSSTSMQVSSSVEGEDELFMLDKLMRTSTASMAPRSELIMTLEFETDEIFDPPGSNGGNMMKVYSMVR